MSDIKNEKDVSYGLGNDYSFITDNNAFTEAVPSRTKKRLEQEKLASEEKLDELFKDEKKETLISKMKKKAEKTKKEKPAKKVSKKDESHNNNNEIKETKGKKKKEKKKRTVKQWIFLILKCGILFGLVCCIAVGIYAYSVIKQADPIDTSDIMGMLSQSSVLYDDQGELYDTIYSKENRTLVEISEIPEHVKYAFICLEDKTFYTHHGFNIIRIFGAIKDAIFKGGQISGTSTITQQLARNLYLQDTRFKHSVKRKIQEAYYTIILEHDLTKDEILEGYLNTINFGMGYGVSTAAKTYFSKDVSELTIAEAAALAALPQAPSKYALVKLIDIDSVTSETQNLIMTDSLYGYVWSDKVLPRMQTCLNLMYAQGKISKEEHDEAYQVQIKDMVNPNFESIASADTNYYADYVIETVITDLMNEYGYSRASAEDLVYNGGLNIYTTLDQQAQGVAEKEFLNSANFPTLTGYRKDSHGNIYKPTTYEYKKNGTKVKKESNEIMLYHYDNYIDSEGYFTLKTDDFTRNSDGSITLIFKKRIAFYISTKSDGTKQITLSFRPLYYIKDKIFYTIERGTLSIPAAYKTIDENNNVTISAQFFTDFPDFFIENADGSLKTKSFVLATPVIQPQAAITIIDNKTGAIKAMVGGRIVSGRNLYNRAVTNRQPGSSIKPLAIYSAALQLSYELSQQGLEMSWTDYGDTFDRQRLNGYGRYLTVSTILDNEPTTIENRIWPTNSTNNYSGITTLREAIVRSYNVCAVKILRQMGANYSYNMVKKFGITSYNENDINTSSLAMGGAVYGVSTLEMASAYTTFVNDGIHKSYYCYDKVTTRNGAVLLEPNKTETKVLDAGVAWITRDLLKSVVTEGAGHFAKINGEEVGGKTGTTSDKFDIWFDGFTPNYTASVWIGTDVNISLSTISYKATQLWQKIMSQVEGAKGGKYSSKPSNVVTATIDLKSGLLATAESTETRTEYYTRGTQPTESGTWNRTVLVCKKTGLLASDKCTDTEYRTGVMRPYIPNPEVLDIDKELPHEYCTECNGSHEPGPEPEPQP